VLGGVEARQQILPLSNQRVAIAGRGFAAEKAGTVGCDAGREIRSDPVPFAQIGNAIARSHVRATHWIDTRFWTVGASYLHRLVRTPEGWRVSAISIHRLYEEGDRAVLAAAADRVKAGVAD
jgi:hypothetical protein